jgi:putative addiction module component (TIGR02574 family)
MTPTAIRGTICAMTLPIEALEAEVLSLPPNERARLLDRLITSLDADRAADDAWMLEARRRDEQLDSGAIKPWPGDVVLAQLRSGLQ